MEKNNGRSWKITGNSWDMGENAVEFTAKNPSGNEEDHWRVNNGSLIGRDHGTLRFHDIFTGNRGYHQLKHGDMILGI